MADQQDPNRPKRPPISLPPQPNQLVDENHKFTPYYLTDEEARRFPGRSTPYLSNSLTHPPEEFAGPRNKFPGSDPIMDARKGGGEGSSQSTAEQTDESKEIGEMSSAERSARDAKEFSSSPPDGLSVAQKKRWSELVKEIFSETKTEEDPHNIRARGELRKLKKLADLAEGKQE